MMLRSVFACLVGAAAIVNGAPAEPNPAAGPVNAICPIGKEPITDSGGTVMYKGKVVGLCCPSCGDAFLAWDEARKDAFVARAVAHTERVAQPAGHGDARSADSTDGVPGYPYTLADCPVGGGKLGSMGEPVVKEYDGREVRFCCSGCIAEFEADRASFWKAIDKKIVDQQLMHYPIDTCVVTDDKLGVDAVNHVFKNRLVRLADADAVEAFDANPAEYLGALDKQIIKAQRPGYPVQTCVVSGQKLGSMGEPVELIYMNRLVRLCCDHCEGKFEKDAPKYMADLDAAYANRDRAAYPLDTCLVSGGRLGGMGEPVELVAGNRLVRFCCDHCLPRFSQDPEKYLSKLPRP